MTASRKQLGIYLMADPALPEIAEAAAEGGADLLEVGFPFSDPLADGPVLRVAATRALQRGMRTPRCLEVLWQTAQRVGVPLVPMTYAALLESYGYQRFAADAHAAGASALIVADLPIDTHPELRRVQLVAPNTETTRLRAAAERTVGWLYLVAVTGVTGANRRRPPQLPALAARARAVTDLPLLAGFGISTPAQAVAAAAVTDGVIVGTAAALVAAEQGAAGLWTYVRGLRTALDSADY